MEGNGPGLLIISEAFYAVLRAVAINIVKTGIGVEIQTRDL
jgi:hypothetical protein